MEGVFQPQITSNANSSNPTSNPNVDYKSTPQKSWTRLMNRNQQRGIVEMWKIKEDRAFQDRAVRDRTVRLQKIQKTEINKENYRVRGVSLGNVSLLIVLFDFWFVKFIALIFCV